MQDAAALDLATRALVEAFPPERLEPMLEVIERAFRMAAAPADGNRLCALCGGHGVPRFPLVRMDEPISFLGAAVPVPGMRPWDSGHRNPDVACLDCLQIVREEHSPQPLSERLERLVEDVRRAIRATGSEHAEAAILAVESAFARAGAPVISRQPHPGCLLCLVTRPCAQGAAKGALCEDCSRDHWRAISTDGLTGASTRALFAARLDALVSRSRRMGRPLALLMLDIDYMKSWNDFHGFLAGDALLTRVPGIMRGAVRDGDVVARWGGEEFAVILPDRIVAEAVAIGEVIRARAFEALRPPEVERDPQEERRVSPGGRPHFPDGRVTVSIGIAGLTPDAGVVGLLRAADERLNDAKLAGRNRVVA